MEPLEVLLAVAIGILLGNVMFRLVCYFPRGEWLMLDVGTWILDRCWWRKE